MNFLRLLLVKHKQQVFLFILIVVLFNYLRIVFFVNDSSLKKCLLDYNNEQDDQNSKLNLNESLISFPSAFKVHSHLKHLNPIYLMPKFKLKNSKRLTAHLVIGISTVKRENNSYLITMLDSLFRAMNNKEKDKVLIVLLIAEVNFLVFFCLLNCQ